MQVIAFLMGMSAYTYESTLLGLPSMVLGFAGLVMPTPMRAHYWGCQAWCLALLDWLPVVAWQTLGCPCVSFWPRLSPNWKVVQFVLCLGSLSSYLHCLAQAGPTKMQLIVSWAQNRGALVPSIVSAGDVSIWPFGCWLAALEDTCLRVLQVWCLEARCSLPALHSKKEPFDFGGGQTRN